AVVMDEGHADFGPLRVLALALADRVGDVRGFLRGLAAVFRVRVRHRLSPCYLLTAPPTGALRSDQHSRQVRALRPRAASCGPCPPPPEKRKVHALGKTNACESRLSGCGGR